jgi:hypothetical protein
MNIKSLLFGSAAALVAVSGARAADAVVVAEPEPAEYVKICDVYGAGYYYIPGTETCLSIRGLVRYQITFDGRDDDMGFGGWRKNILARLNITAKEETEYGTLTGYMRLEGTTNGSYSSNGSYGSSDTKGGFGIVYATITLGGLSMGLYDTSYDFGLDTSNLGGAEFDSYGGDSVHYISYTFDAANGISATIALEEETYNTDYIPNVVGKINVEQGWGGITAAIAYDDDDDDWAGAVDDEFYLKGVARININPQFELALMGIYESGLGTGFYSTGYEWSVGAYGSFKASDKATIGFGGQYFGDAHTGGTMLAGSDAYRVGGDVKYLITQNFSTKLQVYYEDRDDGIVGNDEDHFAGWLRFERSF